MNARWNLNQEAVDQEIDRAIEKFLNSQQDDLERAPLVRATYEKHLEKGCMLHKWDRAPEQDRLHKWEPPESDEQIKQRYRFLIDKEKTYYSLVRVIELPLTNPYRFVLAYGVEDDNRITTGTGPFCSVREAADWFLNGGR